MDHAAQGLSCGRGDQEGVGPQAKINVVGPGSLVLVFRKIAVNPVTGKGGQGEGRNEVDGRLRHDHTYLCSTALQFASEQGRFVGSNAACNSKKNAFVFQHGGKGTPPAGLGFGVRCVL